MLLNFSTIMISCNLILSFPIIVHSNVGHSIFRRFIECRELKSKRSPYLSRVNPERGLFEFQVKSIALATSTFNPRYSNSMAPHLNQYQKQGRSDSRIVAGVGEANPVDGTHIFPARKSARLSVQDTRRSFS